MKYFVIRVRFKPDTPSIIRNRNNGNFNIIINDPDMLGETLDYIKSLTDGYVKEYIINHIDTSKHNELSFPVSSNENSIDNQLFWQYGYKLNPDNWILHAGFVEHKKIPNFKVYYKVL